jgi:hypothetical protein
MSSISNEPPSALQFGDLATREKPIPARPPRDNMDFEELDIIDVMAFLWHARNYILGGMLLGAFFGLGYSVVRKQAEPALTSQASLTSDAKINYRTEFQLRLKSDPKDNKSAERINKMSELFTQPQVLRIFQETIAEKWPEVARKWSGQIPENFVAANPSTAPRPGVLRLTLTLPITVEPEQLTEVMGDIVARINSSVIAPHDHEAASRNKLEMEHLSQLKVEYMKQKSRLNKIYFSLLKVSGEQPQSESITFDRVLALVSKLETEKLINDAMEAQYYQELVDIQTKLDELPKQISAKSSQITQVLLNPVSLDLNEHVTNSVETPSSTTEASQTSSPSPQAHPIRSPGFFAVLGIMLGLFSGLTVAAIKFFFERNWDLIRARINA